MSEIYKSYTLEITVDGRPSTFKVAAIDASDAERKCIEYYHDPELPKDLHKAVSVLSATQTKWEPEGFRK